MHKSPQKNKNPLQPAAELWRLYRPQEAPYRFTAADVSSARKWQTRTRRALGRCLGLETLPSAPPRARVVSEANKGEYIRRKILLRTGAASLMPVYLLLPKVGKRPLPTVLAFHGHGYGAKDIIGLWEDGSERNSPDGYQKDFGVALCRAGFAVAAPEISCFGERQTDFSYLDAALGQPAPSTCAHSAMLALHLGISVPGLRIHDGMRLVDYLETQRDFDVNRLGAMGISGGGMHTFFSACLDTRIKACVVSGYFSTFADSILAMAHCPCNFVAGLAQFGEMHDLAGLIAPRPMLIEAGSRDPIFPIAAVRRGVAKARAVYSVFDAQNRLAADYFEGRHQISGRKAYDFLKQALDPA